MKIFFWIAVVGVASLSSAAAAQTPTPDANVRNALTVLGLKYEVTSGGDFKVTMRTEAASTGNTERFQVVLISSERNETIYGADRIISTLAARAGTAPSADIANALLTENGALTHGSWYTIKTLSGDAFLVGFALRIPANCTLEVLKKSIDYVAVEGDKIEKQITGADAH